MSYKVYEGNPAYPYHIRDVHISDPFIYADPVTKKYYTYVQFVDRNRFPEIEVTEPCFFVLESEEDLLAGATPDPACFELIKAKKYGRTYIHILRYVKEEE